MKVILDTNFIVTCLREKIDFIGQLEEQGYEILVPKEVIEEMKDIRSDLPHDGKMAVDIGIKLIEQRKLKKISLGKKKVDDGLIEKGREGYHIATLDNGIREMVESSIIIHKAQKRVGPA